MAFAASQETSYKSNFLVVTWNESRTRRRIVVFLRSRRLVERAVVVLSKSRGWTQLDDLVRVHVGGPW